MLAFLAACESSEDRAEKHYQTAVELLDKGDVPRALIELRNVFNLNGQHHDARALYAKTVLAEGRTQEAFGQYRLLVEQYPDDIEANRNLAQLAFSSGTIQGVEPYVDMVLRAEPDNREFRSMKALLSYLNANSSDEAIARAKAVTEARALVAEDPTLNYARQVVLNQLMADRDWTGLLNEVDAALESEPKSGSLYRLRLTALQQLGDEEAVEQTLLTMTRTFPEEAGVGQTLIRWYLSRKEMDKAETWLREQINPAVPDPRARLTLVEFLTRFRGPQVALDELTKIEAMTPAPQDIAANIGTFSALRAGLMFSMGEQKAAMLRLEGLLEDVPEGEQADRIKVSLAQMREATGNRVGARALIEEVLENDASNVNALKMRAEWLIEADETSEAIATLRQALDQEPNDASVLTILARAYEREGSRELMLDMLNRAVDASGRAPEPSVRLARVLMQDGQFRSAEDVLIEALRLNNAHVDLLVNLGRVHVGMNDWGRVDQDIERLRRLDTPASNAAADDLKAQQLLAQQKTSDLMDFVEERAGQDKTGEAALIRTLVLSGKVDEAMARAKTFYDANPDDVIARFIYASALVYGGDDATALPLFEGLVEQHPEMTAAWTSLYSAYKRAGEDAKAEEALTRAEESRPQDPNIQWLKAGHYEGEGDIEAAIGIYEAMYAQNSNAPVVANNLASLLSTARTDEESLERAYTVSRRLRDSKVAAFADTYGWIALRRGDLNDAERHLVRASQDLPNDASVQYHVGSLYAAQGQVDRAREALNRALTLLAEGGKGYPGLKEEINQTLQTLPE